MKFGKLESLKLHDKVSFYDIGSTQVWKSHLEYPLGLWSGIPVLYIYSNKYSHSYMSEQKPEDVDKNYYLFQIVKENNEFNTYELMMKGENFDEVIAKGNELQDAYRIKYFEGNKDLWL